MTHKEILEKAIRKAIDGGWLPYFASFVPMTKDNIVIRYSEGAASVNFDYQMKGYVCGVGGFYLEPFSIIFNHDFAKALWGDEGFTITGLKCGNYDGVQRFWEYHLQQMVISNDPIAYLGENI